MKLHFRKYGSGQPLLILHGLFGQSDNWNSLAKLFGENGFEVYAIDQRNHGLSPHSDEWSFQAMSDDLHELITDYYLNNVVVMGHSLGGKTAMVYTLQHPEKVDKLIVADIAPKYYAPHHQSVLAGLTAVDFETVKTRREAEDILSLHISDFGTKQFLLKNIYWKEDGRLDWRFNLKTIAENMDVVGAELPQADSVDVPALFLRGGNSDYIRDADLAIINELFPRSMLETIEGAGHWLHAEKPKEFFSHVISFLK
ncbi:MAG TPA: alpha/beta fold hydrolase [Bacteroidia bacterium]|jgi:pimeloyl-ACP methyl ester carboxylesterase